MHGVLRWIRADLRCHRLASLLVVAATAGTVTALLLAGTLLSAAFDPWQREFRAADAPQVRLDLAPADDGTGDGAPPASLAQLPGVTRLTPLQPTADVTLLGLAHAAGVSSTGDRIPFILRADVPGSPRPLLTDGSWLNSGAQDGLVLERSAAEAAWAHPGDRLTVVGAAGQPVQLRVLGVADSPDQVGYSQAGYGLGWVLPSTLDRIQPDLAAQGRTLGLYLSSPNNAAYVAQRAVTDIGSGRVVRLSTWEDARSSQDQDSRLVGLLLGLSGLATLLAGALAVAGAAAGRIRGRSGDMALLKALGFTRRQLVGMFFAEHLLLAGGGALLGAVLAALLAPFLGSQAGPLPLGPWVTGAVTAIALAAIGAAAALPAGRASRVAAVPPPEGAPGTRRPPRPAHLGALRRFPAAVILGVGSTLRNPRASAVTTLRIAVPMVACILALSTWATLDAVNRGGEGSATHSTLTVRLVPGATAAQSAALPGELARARDVEGVYPGGELQALVPGQSATVTLRALGTTAHPFPYTVVQGRGIRATDEAVAGQAALDLLDVQVGQWVRVTTGGTPRILHIVGRSLEPDLDGRVISTGWDTLDRPGDPAQPTFYSVVLRPGTTPAQAQRELVAQTGLGSRLDVRPGPDPAAQLGGLRGSVVGLVALLAVVVASELLSVAATGLRDHRPALGILRAIGLTPRQAASMMVVRGVVLALGGVVLGALAGIPLALWLINLEGRSEGIGAGIAHAPTAGMLALLALLTAAGACVCALPALRAARSPLPVRH
ncbi:ABC transporter permease [Streptacidiphilus sp. PB12-B1b]|uniref:ABC transporter permease n=1 Tax=Streptacidiphilus sp. PB12-B1b TaxID=2705012 RepID=UPI0015FD9D46|nr:ABC transporter permease [Streptacidiphilus sp. PB12-B1b]QMU77904.1 ABC transporter permease [Streptacidiphilus sp. PB12-B1b]